VWKLNKIAKKMKRLFVLSGFACYFKFPDINLWANRETPLKWTESKIKTSQISQSSSEELSYELGV
jgi:hypothetical protein